MNGYYLHYNATQEKGLKKKIDMQMKQLSTISEIKEINIQGICDHIVARKILMRMPFIYPQRWDYDTAFSHLCEPDYIYIRRNFANRYYIRFLKRIKETYSHAKIIVELPTYPYFKDDFCNFKYWPLYFKELYASKSFRYYIDRFVTYTNDKEIFGVKTIPIMNGIDISRFPQKKPSEDPASINLLAVASFRPYHGYERILEGMKRYYSAGGKRKIRLYFVGNGSEISYYKHLVDSYKLKNVLFPGEKNGDELDHFYNNSDIGLGTFGAYKAGINSTSSLKTREYLAKGLPVISGCSQDVFEKYPCNYHLEFNNDREPVDFDRIIKFYDRLFEVNDKKSNTEKKRGIIDEINRYATKYLTMEKTFYPVIEYLLNGQIEDMG